MEIGVVAALPYPSPTAPLGRFATLSLLHLQPACRVAGGSGIEGKSQDRRAGNPELYPDEGDTVLLLGIWGEGALHLLPPPPGVGKKSVAVEPLPRPILCWGEGSLHG